MYNYYEYKIITLWNLETNYLVGTLQILYKDADYDNNKETWFT